MAFDSESARQARALQSDPRWKNKPFTEALQRALLAPADKRGKRMVDKLADALVNAAANGDIAAIKIVAERIEGKPDQKRVTEHELSISQQMLDALRSAAALPRAKVIDGKVAAVEDVIAQDMQHDMQQDMQQDANGNGDTRTRATSSDLASQLPARRNHGDLVTAARRIARK